MSGEEDNATVTRWYHVGRPWSDTPGLIYAGDEDPHAGVFVVDCGSWSDELHFGERPVLDPAAIAGLIVRDHNAALQAEHREPPPGVELELSDYPERQFEPAEPPGDALRAEVKVIKERIYAMVGDDYPLLGLLVDFEAALRAAGSGEGGLDEAWAAAEAALIEFQGDDDGFGIEIAYWPEFPDEPWSLTSGEVAAVTGATLPDALRALAARLSTPDEPKG